MSAKKQASKQEKQLQRVQVRYPDLKVVSSQPLDGGPFSNDLLVNDDLFFRFPKDGDGLERLRVEAALLQALRGRLPLALPEALYPALDISNPGEAFIGYCLPPGQSLEFVLHTLPTEAAEQLVVDLAHALAGWHALDLTALDIKLPVYNQNRRKELQELREDVRELLLPHLHEEAAESIEGQFRAYLDTLAQQNPPLALVHGEPGPALLFFDPEEERLCGIADFAAAGLNDPAAELGFVAFWVNAYLGEEFVELLLSEYPMDDALHQRAAFFQMVYALLAIVEGIESQDSDLFEAGLEPFI